ncbi:MAG: hypothetical protein NT004_12205 [Bacteroidetes bacterium]|nr:hypothetical protein [Bacteroidota bacterium]
MKSDFLEFIGNARQRRSEKFRVQLSVFLVCLAISIFLWILVKLSKDYYYSVEYHLNYTNLPGNLRIITASDSMLTLKIKLQGFEFFSEQFLIKQDRQFDVSLKNVRVHYSGEGTSGYLLTNRIGREIISQSSFPNDVFFVSPDTLFFEFEKHVSKRMQSLTTADFIKIQIGGRDTLLRITDSLTKNSNIRDPLIKKH